MKSLIYRTGKWEEKEFDEKNSLAFLQKEVGGLIERIPYFDELEEMKIDAWINEEGKLKKLPPSMIVYQDEELIDVICGDIVFTKFTEDGETVGLDENDIDYIKKFIT